MMLTRLHPKFPAAGFISQAEFAEYCRTAQAALDVRYLHETGLTARDDTLVQAGTCAPCLRRTVFTSPTARWEKLADGRRVPDWGAAQVCDCQDALTSRDRALVHFALSDAGLHSAARLLLFGRTGPADRRLAAEAGSAVRIARLHPDPAGPDGVRLGAADGGFDGGFDLAIADGLHRVPPLDAALRELRRVLAAGGSLVVTAPFRYRAARTATRPLPAGPAGSACAEYREPVHEFGWDMLDRLRAAGFGHARAVTYWSAELGYLGSFNMLLHAVA